MLMKRTERCFPESGSAQDNMRPYSPGKEWLSTGLCLTAVCLLLTACGGQGSGAEENGTGAADSQAMYSLTEDSVNVPEGRQVVWIGDLYEDFTLADAVKGFNDSNDTYWAEVVSYGEINGKILSTMDSEAEAAMKRIQLAMTVGTDCPDLMFIDPYWMNVGELAEQGYFEDLNPYLEKSSQLSADDFLDGIPEAFTFNGILITLPRYFSLEFLVGRKSLLEQFDSWTAGDLFAYGEQYPDSVLVACYSEPIVTLLKYGELLRLYEEPPFVVEDDGRKVVDREQLTAFLEKIKEDSQHSLEGLESYPDYYAENQILLQWTSITWLWDIQMYRALFQGDAMFVGYPSEDGRNIKITADDLYGIPCQAQNKEGAWAFLEYYLSRKQDTYNRFPSRKDAFEEALQRDLLHEGYEVNEEGILITEGTNQAMWTDTLKGWTFSAGEIQQEDIDIVRDMISRAGHPFAKDYSEMRWLVIMSEEAGAYFDGQKSIQDVVDIIAVRLQLYLDETA